VVPSKATKCFHCWGSFLTKDIEPPKETQGKDVPGEQSEKAGDCMIFPVKRKCHCLLPGSDTIEIPNYEVGQAAASAGDYIALKPRCGTSTGRQTISRPFPATTIKP
jgi:hypothetical protein